MTNHQRGLFLFDDECRSIITLCKIAECAENLGSDLTGSRIIVFSAGPHTQKALGIRTNNGPVTA